MQYNKQLKVFSSIIRVPENTSWFDQDVRRKVLPVSVSKTGFVCRLLAIYT